MWFLLVSLLPAPMRAAADEAPQEHHVKIAFIYNFAKFVEWPASSLSPEEKTLTVCVIGDDDEEDFENLLRDKKVGDRAVVIKKSQRVRALNGCQIAFLSDSLAYDLDRFLTSAKGLGALIVTETEGAAKRGSMINFYREQNHVRFEINLDAVRREKITISSKLLRLGRIISTESEGRKSR